MSSKKKTLLVCTPVENIDGVLRRLTRIFDVVYLPNARIRDLQGLAVEQVWGLFTNPNRSELFIGSEVFEALPDLRVICTASTGTVHIDLEKAERKSITVISLKLETDFLRRVTSTAELSFTLMLAALRHLPSAMNDVVLGSWDCEKFVGRQVADLKIGVLGMGRLGKIFAGYCLSFGADVVFYDPNVVDAPVGASKVNTLSDFLSGLDVLSIHIHADKNNDNFVSKDLLCQCRDDVIILNTARGEVVNEEDLVDFLSQNSSALYATDVIKDEIQGKSASPILKYFSDVYPSGNILVTPHIGGMSHGARRLAYNKAVDLLEAHLEACDA